MDAADDDWYGSEIILDMSGLGANYISSRLWDLSNLHTLNLENNKLTKIGDQIAYLTKLIDF
jgi:hypothetical protein